MVTICCFLLLTLFYSTTLLAQNKVVVIPLLGEGSSHQHPDMEFLSIPPAAFQPVLSSSNYSLNSGLLSTTTDPDNHVQFVASLVVPNGATIKQVTATYRDGNTARDVEVRVKGTTHSRNLNSVFAEIRSTGISFTQFTSRAASIVFEGGVPRFNPIDNQNIAYVVEASLRNGAALRGVTIGYTSSID